MVDTLGRSFLEVAENDKIVVRFWNNANNAPTYTYGDLAQSALKVAGALLSRGLKEGERVALVLPTNPDFYHAFFGVVLAGGVPTALYPPVRLGRLEEWKQRTAAMLRAASAVCVLTERRMLGLMGEPVQATSPRLGCLTTSSLVKEGKECVPVLRGGDDLAAVQFSSGSTGDPKPVALTHRNMLHNTIAIMSTFPKPLTAQSGVSWLPLYHDMGLIGSLLTAIVGKGDLTLIGPERFVARPRIWLEALTETQATISVAPNFAFNLCTSRIERDDMEGLDLSSWKLALCGAEPVHREPMEAFAEQFSRVGFDRRAITPVYGLAEVTLAATFSDTREPPSWKRFDGTALEVSGTAVLAEEAYREVCCLGRALPGISVSIRNEQVVEVEGGKVGTVWVSGDSVMAGYLDRPEQTQKAIVDGWFDTGDLGFIFEGDLYIYGRRKDIVIIRGRNYDPALIERAMDSVDYIRTGCSAAFGVDDPQQGTAQLVVLAEYRSLPKTEEAAIMDEAFVAVRRETGLSPKVVMLLAPGTLPRTSSGKIRRHEAKRRWMSDELAPPGKASAAFLLKESARGYAAHLKAAMKRIKSRN
jgi:acyl-CoA synthetase (AMP-forming)/AMP-acid ligase II